MDEQNQMPEQDPRIAQAEHTKQNNKDAIKLAEKGAATYFAGPEGAAVVNQLHNTPGIGQALDKVEDKAAEKLGKNRAFSNMANQLGDSGMLQAGNQALDIAGSAGGGAPTGTSPNAAGTQGANVAGGSSPTPGSTGGTSSQTPSGQSGLGGAGGLGLPGGGGLGSGGGNNPPPEGGNEKSASENTIEGVKKTAKVLKLLAPAMPMILTIVGFVLIAVILMAQVMMIKDKISGAIAGTMEFGQKIVNFMTGDGWNTEEEAFFKKLEEAYLNFDGNNGQELDIPLIASTIHYSKTVDISVFDGEEGEKEDEIGKNEDNYTEGTGGGVWGQVIDTAQTWSFYKVATIKLGKMGAMIPGTRGLLGHLVNSYVTFEKVCIQDALSAWGTFFSRIIDFNFTGFNELKQVYDDSTVDAAIDMVSKAIGSFTSIFDLVRAPREFLNNLQAFAMQGQSYTDWLLRSTAYELVEMYEYLTGNYNDKDLLDSPLAYYKNLDGISSEDNNGGLIDMLINLVENLLTSVEINWDLDCPLEVRVPVFNEVLDYKSYYRYLVNIYVPITYFPNMKLGEDYKYEDLITAANEIFDQKYMYEYLVDDLLGYGTALCGSCNYNITGLNTGNSVVKLGEGNSGVDLTNLKVRLLQCADGVRGQPIPNEDLVDFEKYILGVVYAENGGAPAEAAKVQAIAARSYALTRPAAMGGAFNLKLEQEDGQWILQIRNCVEDQVYCDPDRGCSLNSPTTGSNFVTVYSGENTHPYRYKGPLPADSELRKAVAEVAGVLALDSNGNVVLTPYVNTDQNAWNSMASSGKDYTEILLEHYGGKVSQISHSDCSNNCAASGDYTQWKQFGEPWSDIYLGSSSGTIGRIGCLITSISMQIARSGVPVTVNPLNPGTVVQKLNQHGGFTGGGGLYWNAISHVAPSFQYVGQYGLSGSKEARMGAINQLVSDGCYVVIEVKTHNGGQHWVALDYIGNGDIYMMDPASNYTRLYDHPQYRPNIAACYKVVR